METKGKSRKKKIAVTLLIVFASFVALYLVYELALPTRVFFWAKSGSVELHDSGRNGEVSAELSDDDSAAVRNLLIGHWSYYDSPACGFSDENYLQFGNAKFLLGMDNCGTIQTGSKFFTLSEGENQALHAILEKYNVVWPLF